VLKTILKKEILHNLYSLRFLISLVLLTGVFVAGSFSFVRGRALNLEKYRGDSKQVCGTDEIPSRGERYGTRREPQDLRDAAAGTMPSSPTPRKSTSPTPSLSAPGTSSLSKT